MWPKRKPGADGIWILADGRAVFYRSAFSKRGYLVDTTRQERRIRWTFRAIPVVGYVGVLPALLLLDSDIAWAGALLLSLVADYATVRLITRGMRIVDEPLSRALRLRLGGYVPSAGASIAASLFFGVMGIVAMRVGALQGLPWSGLALAVCCALGCCGFAWMFNEARTVRI